MYVSWTDHEAALKDAKAMIIKAVNEMAHFKVKAEAYQAQAEDSATALIERHEQIAEQGAELIQLRFDNQNLQSQLERAEKLDGDNATMVRTVEAMIDSDKARIKELEGDLVAVRLNSEVYEKRCAEYIDRIVALEKRIKGLMEENDRFNSGKGISGVSFEKYYALESQLKAKEEELEDARIFCKAATQSQAQRRRPLVSCRDPFDSGQRPANCLRFRFPTEHPPGSS
jgi:chromosome segregation ATPase